MWIRLDMQFYKPKLLIQHISASIPGLEAYRIKMEVYGNYSWEKMMSFFRRRLEPLLEQMLRKSAFRYEDHVIYDQNVLIQTRDIEFRQKITKCCHIFKKESGNSPHFIVKWYLIQMSPVQDSWKNDESTYNSDITNTCTYIHKAWHFILPNSRPNVEWLICVVSQNAYMKIIC